MLSLIVLVGFTSPPSLAQSGGINEKHPSDDIQRYLIHGIGSDVSFAHVRYHGLHFHRSEKGLTKPELRALAEDALRYVAFSYKPEKMARVLEEMVARKLDPGFVAMFERAWDWRRQVAKMTREEITKISRSYRERPGNLHVHNTLARSLEIEAKYRR